MTDQHLEAIRKIGGEIHPCLADATGPVGFVRLVTEIAGSGRGRELAPHVGHILGSTMGQLDQLEILPALIKVPELAAQIAPHFEEILDQKDMSRNPASPLPLLHCHTFYNVAMAAKGKPGLLEAVDHRMPRALMHAATSGMAGNYAHLAMGWYSDEHGRLTGSFNAMTPSLRALMALPFTHHETGIEHKSTDLADASFISLLGQIQTNPETSRVLAGLTSPYAGIVLREEPTGSESGPLPLLACVRQTGRAMVAWANDRGQIRSWAHKPGHGLSYADFEGQHPAFTGIEVGDAVHQLFAHLAGNPAKEISHPAIGAAKATREHQMARRRANDAQELGF